MAMLLRLLTAALVSLAPIAFAELTGTASAAGPAQCKADAERSCPGITPGEGKLIGCLKEHKDEVSIGCAKTLKGIKEKMGK
jgi:hypothetical protein